MRNLNQMNLSAADTGSYVCTQITVAGDAATRMKQMGLSEGREIELLTIGDPMIVRLGESEIGLSRSLAQSIRVRPVCQTSPATTPDDGSQA